MLFDWFFFESGSVPCWFVRILLRSEEEGSISTRIQVGSFLKSNAFWSILLRIWKNPSSFDRSILLSEEEGSIPTWIQLGSFLKSNAFWLIPLRIWKDPPWFVGESIHSSSPSWNNPSWRMLPSESLLAFFQIQARMLRFLHLPPRRMLVRSRIGMLCSSSDCSSSVSGRMLLQIVPCCLLHSETESIYSINMSSDWRILQGTSKQLLPSFNSNSLLIRKEEIIEGLIKKEQVAGRRIHWFARQILWLNLFH